MKQYAFAGLAAALIRGELIASAPPAGAGWLYGGLVVSRCDGSVQRDGTWQRCVVFPSTSSSGLPGSISSYHVPETRCDVMGPDLHPWGLAFSDPPTHIDD
jgi:hypothetical protein